MDGLIRGEEGCGERISRLVGARKPAIVASAVLLAAMLSGCGPDRAERISQSAVTDYYSGAFPEAADKLRPLAKEPNGDFVLNNLRLGSVAMTAGDLDEAEAAFLRAYEVINSVGVNNGGRTIGAVVAREDNRIWKGEPFERAMANHYLGLVYYMRGDYANARGAYENALFKLRDYGEKADEKNDYREIESDFALGSLMLGKCWQHLDRSDLAQANFDRALQLRPDLTSVINAARSGRSNVLLVVDFGYGPQKIDNFDGALAGFSPTPAQAGLIPPLSVIVDGRLENLRAEPPMDLLALAQQRKWQSMDTVRMIKDVAGYGLMAAGAYRGVRHDDPLTSLALIGAGALLQRSAKADIRYWETLPRTTYIVPLELPQGPHTITVDFPVRGLSQTWRGLVAPPPGQEATYYFRVMRWRNGPFDWPPAGLAPQTAIGNQPVGVRR